MYFDQLNEYCICFYFLEAISLLIKLLYPKCVNVRNDHFGYPKSECAFGISQMWRSFRTFASPKCAFIPNDHLGYPKWSFRIMSQMIISDNVPNAYLGYPKWSLRISQMTTSDNIPNAHFGYPKWPLRTISQMTLRIIF